MSGKRLVDTYSRHINYMRLSITDRCNLRCTYCMPEEGISPVGHSKILSYEEILRVAKTAISLGITKIRITGGEPLVRKGVCSLIENLSALEGLEDISLTTNGTLLGKMAGDLKKAGLGRINISLDTLNRDTFKEITRVDALGKVLEGIKAAKEAGLNPIKVNVVVIRGVNDGEVLEFVDFAAKNDIEVRFIEFMPSREERWAESELVKADEILEIVRSRHTLTPIGRNKESGPCRVFGLEGTGRVGVISPMSDHFCGDCNRVRITADGKLRGCLFSSEEVDLRAILRDPKANDEDLADILRNTVHLKPEKHVLTEKPDAKCGLSMSRVGG